MISIAIPGVLIFGVFVLIYIILDMIYGWGHQSGWNEAIERARTMPEDELDELRKG